MRALAVSLLLFASCAATVHAPREVREPVAVFVLEEAWHTGLVLPEADGFVEYGFGEYEWYALGHDRVADVARTLLWPSDGTLARRRWPARDEDALRQQAWYCRLQRVTVERDLASRLAQELHAEFEAAGRPALGHADTVLRFQPSRDDYWLFWNCNDAAAAWLRRLGCEVGRPVVCTGVRVLVE